MIGKLESNDPKMRDGKYLHFNVILLFLLAFLRVVKHFGVPRNSFPVIPLL